jgi:predicted nucleic acid-binding protein
MQTIIIDTNIIFSTLIGKSSTIEEIILSSKNIHFYSSDYMHIELHNHHEKLKKASGLTDKELNTAKYELFKYIRFISLEIIPEKYWQEAEVFVTGVDVDDIAFVALALYLDAYLWTGDKILYKGLKNKGFEKVISTPELKLLF